jgi:hypothetical protein
MDKINITLKDKTFQLHLNLNNKASLGYHICISTELAAVINICTNRARLPLINLN